MPFSHHSHSGEFCLHAADSLEEMIQTAISKGMKVFAMTEHMPRDQIEDLYPEEVGPHHRHFGPSAVSVGKREEGRRELGGVSAKCIKRAKRIR